MGLDFSHGDAQWSYRGFNRFREKLAAAEGIILDNMVGFGGTLPWDGVTSTLEPLLYHSDCDGVLTAQQCAAVAPRLRTVLATWTGHEDEYDMRNGQLLADAMDQCAIQGDDLKFM